MRWTAHNVRLGDDEWAFGQPTVGPGELVTARLVQLTSDLLGPLDGLRVLDLACLEGLYGLELAMHGAEVLAIEGREQNAAKVRHAAERLCPARFQVRVEDVRELDPARHGTFDVVLCLGVLYHLDGADAIGLAEAVAACTRRLAIVRTAIGLRRATSISHQGREYKGFIYPEQGGPWAGIGNPTSFWPTRASLLNLLADVGFTSVLEAVAPPVMAIDGAEDAIFLACLKGSPASTLAAPPESAPRYLATRWPENHKPDRHPVSRVGGGIRSRLTSRRYWRRRMRASQ